MPYIDPGNPQNGAFAALQPGMAETLVTEADWTRLRPQEPPPGPDWGGFMDAIAVSLYDAIHVDKEPVTKRLMRLEAGADWGGADDPIFTYWNTPAGPILTTKQHNTLTAALTAHYIPATATRDEATGVVTISSSEV